jgi:hypothetical protein
MNYKLQNPRRKLRSKVPTIDTFRGGKEVSAGLGGNETWENADSVSGETQSENSVGLTEAQA